MAILEADSRELRVESDNQYTAVTTSEESLGRAPRISYQYSSGENRNSSSYEIEVNRESLTHHLANETKTYAAPQHKERIATDAESKNTPETGSNEATGQEIFESVQEWVRRAYGEDGLRKIGLLSSEESGEEDKAEVDVETNNHSEEEPATVAYEATETKTEKDPFTQRVGRVAGRISVKATKVTSVFSTTTFRKAAETTTESPEEVTHRTLHERVHSSRAAKTAAVLAITGTLGVTTQANKMLSDSESGGSTNVNVEAVEYLSQMQEDAALSVKAEEVATEESVNEQQANGNESAESGSSLVDVSEKYGLPDGYLQHTGEFYQIEAMTYAPTNSITDASEHILRDHFRRDPSNQEVANLAKLIGDRHLEEGEKLHIRKEDIDTIYEAYDVELNGSREDYVKKLAGVAYKVGREYGIPYEAILAQSAHESNWGQSGLTRDANNFFGIKTGSRWNGASHTLPTREVINGRSVTVGADFRAYGNTYEGLKGYAEFIHNTPLYHEALNHSDDPVAYIQKIYEAGYATDPTYVAKTNSTLHEVRTYLAGMTGPQTETNVTQYEKKPETDTSSSQEVVAASVEEPKAETQQETNKPESETTTEQGSQEPGGQNGAAEKSHAEEEAQSDGDIRGYPEVLSEPDVAPEVGEEITNSTGNIVMQFGPTTTEGASKSKENTNNAENHTAEEPKPEDVQEQEEEQSEPKTEQASTSQPEPKPESEQVQEQKAEQGPATRQEFAQHILRSGNVTGDPRYMKQIEAMANGDASCNINHYVLGALAEISNHHDVYITSLNRNCTGVLTASGTASSHYKAGGGHAFDIGIVDGVESTGNTNKDRELLQMLDEYLPAGSAIGQNNCRQVPLLIPEDTRRSLKFINDSCDHIHIEVPTEVPVQ